MKKVVLSFLLVLSVQSCVNSLPSPIPSLSSSPRLSPSPSTIPINAKGTLQGHLTIGPLCPVEPCQITDEQKKLAYEARKIQIYNNNYTSLFMEIIADYKTEMYKTDLPVGDYLIKVTNGNLNNIDPKSISITENNITQLDLDIDTGIR